MTRETSAPEGGDEPSYSYRASAVGAPRVFRLSGQSLEWEIGRHSGRIGLDRITRVRMSYRPVAMQNNRFVTEIWSHETPRLAIISASWKNMLEQVSLDNDYRAFIVGLHGRLAAAKSTTRFEVGINPLLYGAGLLLFAAAGLGVAALIVRAIQGDTLMGALMIGVFLALFAWHGTNYFRRNRPGRYRPDMLPQDLLPRAQG